MSLGLAILARNSADTIGPLIDQFKPITSQAAVVIGGTSSDDTAEIARSLGAKVGYADTVITPAFLVGAASVLGDPEIPEKYSHLNGSLGDFGAARQQSFDMLDTDWCIVVDTDDEWYGLEEIPGIIDKAEHRPVVRVQYSIQNSVIYQPRLFKRTAGHWGPTIHERFIIPNDAEIGITSDCGLRQSKTSGPGRMAQNILLGRLAIAHNPTDYRAKLCLAQDYLGTGDRQSAEPLLDQCINDWDGEYNESYTAALHLRGVLALHNADYEKAALTALRALGARQTGAAWTVLAEASLRMANGSGSHGLHELAVLASDRAMATGKPRYGFGMNKESFTTMPALIKAMALAGMNRPDEALHTVDLGLAMAPDHQELNRLQKRLCGVLNLAP